MTRPGRPPLVQINPAEVHRLALGLSCAEISIQLGASKKGRCQSGSWPGGSSPRTE